jgi:tripartite-type tricarboxylate transporter receptor subunit TctC
MKFPRRRFLHLAAGAIALPAVSRIAGAQTYPSRPVAGFAAGGNTDLHARLMGQWLSGRFGQQFIVENRAGAGGSIATESVVRAAPDGHTLLLTASNDAWNTTLYDETNASLADPRLKQRITELGDATYTSSPTEFGKFIADYTDKWAKVIRAGGIEAG